MPLSIGFNLETLGELLFPNALSVIILFGILAFFGYRLFRYFLVIGGAVCSGLVGYTVISPLMMGLLDLSTPSQFLLSALLAIMLALAGGLLVNRFMRPSVYLFTACVGFYLFHQLSLLLGQRVAPLAFLSEAAPAAIFATIMGLAFGSLVLPCFKILYVVITSIGGLTLAGYLIADLFFDSSALPYVFAVLGLIGGVFAMRYQLRTNVKSRTPGDTDDDADEIGDPTDPMDVPLAPKKKKKSKQESSAPAKRQKAAKKRHVPKEKRLHPRREKKRKARAEKSAGKAKKQRPRPDAQEKKAPKRAKKERRIPRDRARKTAPAARSKKQKKAKKDTAAV